MNVDSRRHTVVEYLNERNHFLNVILDEEEEVVTIEIVDDNLFFESELDELIEVLQKVKRDWFAQWRITL